MIGNTAAFGVRELAPAFESGGKPPHSKDAGNGTKAGPVLGRHWPATPATWDRGSSGGTLHAPRPTQEKSIGQDEQDLQDFERSQKRIPSSSWPSC